MNDNQFIKWLKNKLIPNLTEPSVIVMDNASYHVTQINKSPRMNTLKVDIRKWLTENSIPFVEGFTKVELLCLVKESNHKPLYEAEKILKEHGNEVLKLTQYHCVLNLIELNWSLAKRKMASKNLGVLGSETEIRECFASMTTNDWKKYIEHIIHVENMYKEKDKITEDELEQFLITLVCDSDSDESYEGIEYLDCSFDYKSE